MAPTPPFPLFTTLPPRSVLGLKGMPTTSWATFAIEAQGKIAYTLSYKKAVPINLTHLLVNYRLFNRWMDDNFSESKLGMIQDFFNEHMKVLFVTNGFGVVTPNYQSNYNKPARECVNKENDINRLH